MPFVGQKGAAGYPAIKRVDLISGEQWLREGRGYRPPSPAGAAGIGVSRTPGLASPRQAFKADSRNNWLEEMVRAPVSVWEHGGVITLSSVNRYGYVSRSESLYPELYKPIDTKFWKPLTQEERTELVARAAAANTKATFEDEAYRPVASTAADEQYLDAQSRRAQALRRRRKPRNYDERKKDEELRRKETLVRKYSGPAEQFFRDSSAIVKSGPLDTPILVDGLPVFGKADNSPAPQKLGWLKPVARVFRPANGGRSEDLRHYDDEGALVGPQGELPAFSPLAGKKTQIIRHTNNPWGLKSWSEMLYPEAYREISSVYWKQLSDADRQKIMAVQARAMEKVGYEPGTTKLFIEPIERDDGYVVRRGGRTDDTAGGGRSSFGEAFVTLVIVLLVLAALLWAGGSMLDDSVSSGAALSSGAGGGGGEE